MAPYHQPLMLLGASVVLFAAVGIDKASAVHGGCVLTGLLLWLLGLARLLLLFATRLPLPLPGPGGAPTTTAAAASSASAAVDVDDKPRKHCSILGRQDPEPTYA